MPDKEGKLSEEEKEKILDFFKKTTGRSNCPMCGQEKAYVLSTYLIFLSTSRTPGSGKFSPCAYISCKKCGNVQLHNVFRKGVLTAEDFENEG